MRQISIPVFAFCLAACGGGGSSSGTAGSSFVGTYNGTTTITISSNIATASASEAISVFVRADGTVLVGNPDEIFGSGPLNGNSIVFSGEAAVALDDASCSGTVFLNGTFFDTGGVVSFSGTWSSNDVVCAGTSVTVGGTVDATRTSLNASVSGNPRGGAHPATRVMERLRR